MIMQLNRHHERLRVYSLIGAGTLALTFLCAFAQGASATELQNSEIDIAFHQLRYGAQERIANFKDGDETFTDITESLAEDLDGGELPGQKSVFKAGILSLLVPGLGQVYNGSHIGKVALFAGAEVGLLLGANKFDNDANDIVVEFETFARANWSESDYWDYLNQVYGDTTDADDDLGSSHGHHLPATETQQYFEMLGKYDQFSYGWARTEDFGPDDTLVWNPTTHRYANGNRYPSPKRIAYNNMRADANTTFDKRDRMVIFVLLNHIVSSVDAIVSANRHNKALYDSTGGLSFHPSVRHDENWALIPELKLSWRF